MEVITIQSEAFQQIMTTLKAIQHQVSRINDRKARLEDEYIDTVEACKLLKLSRKSLERYRAYGNLPYVKIKRKVYYKISDLEEFLTKREHNVEKENIKI